MLGLSCGRCQTQALHSTRDSKGHLGCLWTHHVTLGSQRWLQTTPGPWPGCPGWDLHWQSPAHSSHSPAVTQHNTCCTWCYSNNISSFAHTENVPYFHYSSNFPTSHAWGIPTFLLATRWVFFNRGVSNNLHRNTAECTRLRITLLSHIPAQDCSLWVRATVTPMQACSMDGAVSSPKSFTLQKLKCWLAPWTLGGMLIWVLVSKNCVFITLSSQAEGHGSLQAEQSLGNFLSFSKR